MNAIDEPDNKTYNHRHQGQSLVEMAIALPILLILFLGMVEVVYYMYANITVHNVSREAARVAIKETTDHNINDWATLVMSDVVKSSSGSFLQPSSADDTVVVAKINVDLSGSLTCLCTSGVWPANGQQGPDIAKSQLCNASNQCTGLADVQAKITQMQGDLGHTSGLKDDTFIMIEYVHRHHPIIGLTVVAPDGVTLYSSSTMRLIGQ